MYVETIRLLLSGFCILKFLHFKKLCDAKALFLLHTLRSVECNYVFFFFVGGVRSRVLPKPVRNTATTRTADQFLITFVFRISTSVQRSASYASDLFNLNTRSCSQFGHLHYSNQCKRFSYLAWKSFVFQMLKISESETEIIISCVLIDEEGGEKKQMRKHKR